jgi:hypothetical protein
MPKSVVALTVRGTAMQTTDKLRTSQSPDLAGEARASSQFSEKDALAAAGITPDLERGCGPGGEVVLFHSAFTSRQVKK